jgi:hypothetical protein
MMQTNGTAKVSNGEMMERVVAAGDLAGLQPMERAQYYVRVCESVGLNPLTKPFAYITLNGKLTLYALRDATDQLRSTRNVSIRIVSRDLDADGVYTVTARARMADGREDESTGCVHIAGLKGESLANAKMKAETKAKRRVTLSICGLGWLDESEAGDVRSAKFVEVDSDGVIHDKPPSEPDLTKQLTASVEKVEWDKWAAGHLAFIETAEDKGMLNEAWAAVNADIKRLKPPTVHQEALRLAKDARKASLS